MDSQTKRDMKKRRRNEKKKRKRKKKHIRRFGVRSTGRKKRMRVRDEQVSFFFTFSPIVTQEER